MNNILILHGWGSCAKNWNQVKELLENHGYKVFTPDLPGFGENPPPSRAWTIDDYTEWVSEFCEKNNLSQFFLLGHSFGGGLAVKFVNSFPGNVRALILVGAKIRRQKSFRYYIFLTLSKLGKLIFFIPGFSFFQPFARKVLYRLIGTKDYYQLRTKKTITMKETFKKVIEHDLVSCLSKIKVPTLIIWGEKDDVTPLKDAYLINKEIKGSKLEIIKGGKHAPNIETPEILVKKILEKIR